MELPGLAPKPGGQVRSQTGWPLGLFCSLAYLCVCVCVCGVSVCLCVCVCVCVCERECECM